MATFLALLGMFISVVLIGIILLQRGRGGGLVGALSGLGGQSAFGTKAGDTFTRITIGIAAAWVVLAGIHGHVLRSNVASKTSGLPDQIEAPLKDKEPSASSPKSSDSKKGKGLGVSVSDEPDEVGLDVDPKKKPTTDKPATKEKKEDKSDDLKAPEADAKPADKKSESKKADVEPKGETKKDDESK